MGIFDSLRAYINANIRNNDVHEISGDSLNSVLQSIISNVGDAEIKGIAIPSTNPGIPTHVVYYIALTTGTYTYFGHAITSKGTNLFVWNINTLAWDRIQLQVFNTEAIRKSIYTATNTEYYIDAYAPCDYYLLSFASSMTGDNHDNLGIQVKINGVNVSVTVPIEVVGYPSQLPLFDAVHTGNLVHAGDSVTFVVTGVSSVLDLHVTVTIKKINEPS